MSKTGGQPPTKQSENTIGELAHNINNLPEEHKVQLIQMLASEVSIQSTFTGPLPPPDDLEKYEKVLPGLAERIMVLAENEQRYRKDMQEKILANDSKRITAATWLGTTLIAVAALATWLDRPIIAISLGLAGVISALLRHLLNWLNPPRD